MIWKTVSITNQLDDSICSAHGPLEQLRPIGEMNATRMHHFLQRLSAGGGDPYLPGEVPSMAVDVKVDMRVRRYGLITGREMLTLQKRSVPLQHWDRIVLLMVGAGLAICMGCRGWRSWQGGQRKAAVGNFILAAVSFGPPILRGYVVP